MGVREAKDKGTMDLAAAAEWEKAVVVTAVSEEVAAV
jgi:hypothetical protein